jgi:cerevisin
MSLGGDKSQALNDAVNGAVDSGLHFAVAAGGENRDACSFSPAGAEKAITVGASTIGDEPVYFSNYSRCINIFAPGLNILSTWIESDSANNTISGTSMASSHVAGLLAYLLSIYPRATFDPRTSSLVSEEHNAQRPFTGSVTT